MTTKPMTKYLLFILFVRLISFVIIHITYNEFSSYQFSGILIDIGYVEDIPTIDLLLFSC